MALDPIAGHSAELFAKCFGARPRWAVAAPGRVNLIGEHTDYNDGFVLPMAIDRHTIIAASRNHRGQAIIHSETTGETAQFDVRGAVQKGDPPWSNYIRGVVAGFQRLGFKVPGFNAVVESTLPYGGGLASSAALEVAAATLLEVIVGKKLNPLDKALLCQRAEHEFADVPCGIMDQYTAILGRKEQALLLDCRSREVTPVRIKDPSVAVLVINTHVRHRLAEGEYARRRAQCEEAARVLRVPALREASMAGLTSARSRMKPVVFRRARHVVTENERTLQAARAIESADWTALGRLMYASHESLRDDYEVSSPELDLIVEIAHRLGHEQGVLGCRMTGAGFGGCAVSLVRTNTVKVVTRAFADAYERKTRTEPGLFWTRPVAGARVLHKG